MQEISLPLTIVAVLVILVAAGYIAIAYSNITGKAFGLEERNEDYCTDSDAGIKEKNFGTVSGNQKGAAFQYADYCDSGEYLMEYYCEGANANQKRLSCTSTNPDSYCSVGACK